METPKNFVPPQPDFNFFISTLAMQASIFLGELEHPITNKKQEDLPQAKFLIDTIEMLQGKTKGNLSDEEGKLLDNILFNLRMLYLEKTKNKESKG